MRQTLDFPLKQRLRIPKWLTGRAMRYLAELTCAFFGSMTVACLSLGSRTLPVAACLCAVLQGTRALASILGALCGYFLMFDFLDALEPAAAGVMLFCLGAILRQAEIPTSTRTRCFLAFCTTCSVGLIYAVGLGGPVMVLLVLRCAVAIGTVWAASQLLRERPPAILSPEVRTQRTADALRQVGRLLHFHEAADRPGDVAALYDRVCDKVCLRCSGYLSCWEREAGTTYRQLRSAAPKFLRRGSATAADFPTDFLANCRQPDGFVSAINEELDASLSQMQTRHRREEYRLVLSEHYRLLSQLVGSRTPPTAKAQPRFRPELGVRALGRRGNRISGDQGACFTQSGMLYLLLCDGMGTGPDAAQEAKAAIALLGCFLKAGAHPEEALQLLNGAYILRGNGCFSTVDLLQLDLSSGTGELYKWGAAPSYLVSRKSVKKIGTATPPPGLGNESHPDRLWLSLQKGEKLVLVSDGAYGPATELCLASMTDADPQKIASEVVAQHAADGEDDMSAVVLCLRPDETASSIP